MPKPMCLLGLNRAAMWSDGNKPTTSCLGIMRTNCSHRRERNQIKYSKRKGKLGKHATGRPTGHNTKEWNPWVCVCGPWMCSAFRPSSHTVGTVSPQRDTWDDKACEAASFPGLLGPSGISPGELAEREGTNEHHCPYGGRNGGDPVEIWRWAIVEVCTQNLPL